MNAAARVGRRAGTVGLFAVLAIAAIIQLVPFYVALTTSFKSRTDLSSQWLPPFGGFTGENYVTAIIDGRVLQAIGNSLIVTVVSTVLICVVGAFAAYPLARRLTRLNSGITLLVLGALIIPPLSVLVPLYSLMSDLHGVNTYWGIIVLMVTTELPLSIFLYSNFMRSIPVSLEEAARVDGANIFQVFFRIVMPLLKPVTATVVILTSVHVWNEYQLSVYMLTTPDVRTVAPAIGAFFSESNSNLGAAAAAALLGALPVVVVYVFLQRYFIAGMVLGSDR